MHARCLPPLGQVARESKAGEDKLKLKFNLKNLPENQKRAEQADYHNQLVNRGRDKSKQIVRTERKVRPPMTPLATSARSFHAHARGAATLDDAVEQRELRG